MTYFVSLNKKNMPRRLIISDESINSYGFWIRTEGIDLSQFSRNPILLWMHNRPYMGREDEVLPIGKVVDLKLENGVLSGMPVFDQNDDFAKKIESKWESGILNMGSAGLRVIEESEDPKWIKPGQRRMTVLKSKLREVSIVDIGSNDNALGVALYDEDGTLLTLSADNEDKCPVKLLSNKKNTNMKLIALALGLAETATEAEIEAKTKEMATENQQLKQEKADRELAEKNAKTQEAVQLVDKAVKEGRIDAKAKDHFLKLFAIDFEAAKLSLESISKPANVAAEIESRSQGDNSEESRLAKLSWDELDRGNHLVTLKEKYPVLYTSKFNEKFKK